MADKAHGTLGRVYGGNPDLIHIPDGERKECGEEVASFADFVQRTAPEGDPFNRTRSAAQLLCPGCYMVMLFNAAVKLAEQNGQSLTELGNTMAAAFKKLAETSTDSTEPPYVYTEEINVILDPS